MKRRFGRRTRGTAIAILATAFTLSACSSSSGSADAPTDDGSTTIVVYSPQGAEKRGDYVVEQAKKQIGVDVKFVAGAGGELADRLRAEKNNPRADVVLGLVQPAMYQLKNVGLFTTFKPEWADALGAETRDKDNQFHSFWQTPIVLAVNSAFPDPSLTAWTDLAGPKFRAKFALTNPGSQTTQAYLVGILWRYADKTTGKVSDEGWDVLRRIYANAVSVPAGKNLDYGLVKSGQTPIALSYLGGVQTNASDNSMTMNYINATGGSPYVMESVALMKSTKRKAAAEKFINWFGSGEFQAQYVKDIGNVIPLDAKGLEAVPAPTRELLQKIQRQSIDWSVVAENLNDWIEKVQLDYVK